MQNSIKNKKEKSKKTQNFLFWSIIMSADDIIAFKKNLNKYLLKTIKINCLPLYHYLSTAFRNNNINYTISKVTKIYIYPTEFKPVKPGNKKPKEFINYDKISILVEFPVVMFSGDPYKFISENANVVINFDGFEGVSGFFTSNEVPKNVAYRVISRTSEL